MAGVSNLSDYEFFHTHVDYAERLMEKVNDIQEQMNDVNRGRNHKESRIHAINERDYSGKEERLWALGKGNKYDNRRFKNGKAGASTVKQHVQLLLATLASAIRAPVPVAAVPRQCAWECSG